MASAKQILKQLQAEVDEARDALVNEVVNTKSEDLTAEVYGLTLEYRERVARLDKAKGAA